MEFWNCFHTEEKLTFKTIYSNWMSSILDAVKILQLFHVFKHRVTGKSEVKATKSRPENAIPVSSWSKRWLVKKVGVMQFNSEIGMCMCIQYTLPKLT